MRRNRNQMKAVYVREDGALTLQIGIRIPETLLNAIQDEIEIVQAREGIPITRSQMVVALLKEAVIARRLGR